MRNQFWRAPLFFFFSRQCLLENKRHTLGNPQQRAAANNDVVCRHASWERSQRPAAKHKASRAYVIRRTGQRQSSRLRGPVLKRDSPSTSFQNWSKPKLEKFKIKLNASLSKELSDQIWRKVGRKYLVFILNTGKPPNMICTTTPKSEQPIFSL